MGLGNFLGHLGSTVVHGLEDAGSAVVHGVEDAVSWTGDLFSGDLGTQPVPLDAAVAQVLGGSSDSWHANTQTATGLSTSHDQISQRVNSVMANLTSTWTGTAADAAQGRIKKLADVTNSAATTFTANAQNLDDVAHSFDYAKQNLTPMPPRPDKGFFDEVSFWKTDTEAAVDQYNATAKKNQDVYNGYAATSQSNSGTLKIDYGQLGAYDGGDVSLTKPTAGPPPPGHGKGVDNPSHSPGDGGNVNSQFSPGPGQQGGSTGSLVNTGGPGQQGGNLGGDQTSTAGFNPPPVNTPSGFPNGPTPGSAGGLAASLGSPGGVGDLAALGGLSSGGGSGSGLGSGGGIKAGGTAPEPGKRSGAGAFADEPTPEGAGGKTAPSRSGNSSTSLGAPGGRGKGEKSEDEEHRRKYGLNDDAPFIGDGTIDPTTGWAVAPPVIGA